MPTLPEGRRARKRQQTADRLVEVAFELFTAHGYDQVTMEQIAAAADVAKGTLYNHFPVKEALLQHRFHSDLGAALPRLFAEMAALPDWVARLRAFLQASAGYTERVRDYMGPYIHYRLSQPVDTLGRDNRSGFHQVYARFLAEGQAEGEIAPEASIEKLADYLQFMHLCTVMRWLRTPDASLAADFGAMLDLFLDGARGGKAKA